MMDITKLKRLKTPDIIKLLVRTRLDVRDCDNIGASVMADVYRELQDKLIDELLRRGYGRIARRETGLK